MGENISIECMQPVRCRPDIMERMLRGFVMYAARIRKESAKSGEREGRGEEEKDKRDRERKRTRDSEKKQKRPSLYGGDAPAVTHT